jgi:predicted Na+-dependent transporter
LISTPLDVAQPTNWVCCSPGSSAAVMATVDSSGNVQLSVPVES